MNWDLTRQILLHEWAHCVAWQEGVHITDHGPEFGLAYARVYQTVMEK